MRSTNKFIYQHRAKLAWKYIKHGAEKVGVNTVHASSSNDRGSIRDVIDYEETPIER